MLRSPRVWQLPPLERILPARTALGEYAHHGGYHFYPTDEQVRKWLAEAGFTVDETAEGDGYLHYLSHM